MRFFRRIDIFLSIFLCFYGLSCSTNTTKSSTEQKPEPSLSVSSKDKSVSFRRSELLRSPLLKKITVEDPSFKGQKIQYQVVPLWALLKDFSAESDSSSLNFKCLDGFSNSINAKRLLNKDPSQSIASIAIETSDQPWMDLNSKQAPGVTAGPFYLVWEKPELSKISPEEWPYQLSGFEFKPALSVQYPHTAPALSDLKKNVGLKIGYEKFMQNCFACHTLNGEGEEKIGPDLNLPFGPTEYLRPEYLKILVRNPQKLRHWPQGKMTGFNRTALSDSDLQNVIQYLQYMSRHKVSEP